MVDFLYWILSHVWMWIYFKDSAVFFSSDMFPFSHCCSVSSEASGAETTHLLQLCRRIYRWLLQVNSLITALKMKGCGCQQEQQYFTSVNTTNFSQYFLTNKTPAFKTCGRTQTVSLRVMWCVCSAGTSSVFRSTCGGEQISDWGLLALDCFQVSTSQRAIFTFHFKTGEEEANIQHQRVYAATVCSGEKPPTEAFFCFFEGLLVPL